MTRPAHAIIDTQAFVANYRYAKSLAKGARALAVIKANGYGHGAVPLARALGDEADGFGVACCEEALELRESGIDQRIVLLEGVFEPGEIDLAARHSLTIVVHSPHQVDWLLDARLTHPLPVWLKVDSGMHRLGFSGDTLHEAYHRLRSSDKVASILLMSHFARADETGAAATGVQQSRFEQNVAGIDAAHSLANSAAILAWPDTHRDWVRPGIMLYGSSPLADDRSHDEVLQAAMHLRSELIAIRELDAGDAIGYGGRYVCREPTRVGVVAIGYADGYPRHAPDGTPLAVNGHATQLIGRVSMDMITVDLGPLPDARVGDPVELWGTQVPANAVAGHCGTIAYELFTRVTRRVHLHYR